VRIPRDVLEASAGLAHRAGHARLAVVAKAGSTDCGGVDSELQPRVEEAFSMARSGIFLLKAQFPLGEQMRVAWAGTDW
jgi:hypothetical protein